MFNREKLREIGEAYAKSTINSVKTASGGNITFDKSDELINVYSFNGNLFLAIRSLSTISDSQSHSLKHIDKPIELMNFSIDSDYCTENTQTGLFHKSSSFLSTQPFYLDFTSRIYTDRLIPNHGFNSDLRFKALSSKRTRILDKISKNNIGSIEIGESVFPRDMEKSFKSDFNELIKLIRKLKVDDIFGNYNTEDLVRILLMKREMDDRITDAHDRQIEADGFKKIMIGCKQ